MLNEFTDEVCTIYFQFHQFTYVMKTKDNQ